MDATDSFTTRLDLNRACIAAGRAWVSGAAIRSEGQLTVFDPSRPTACYRCLYPEGEAAPDLSCSEAGVLSPARIAERQWSAEPDAQSQAGRQRSDAYPRDHGPPEAQSGAGAPEGDGLQPAQGFAVGDLVQ